MQPAMKPLIQVHSRILFLSALAALVSILAIGCGPDTGGADATAEQQRENAAREARRRQSDQHTLESLSPDLVFYLLISLDG